MRTLLECVPTRTVEGSNSGQLKHRSGGSRLDIESRSVLRAIDEFSNADVQRAIESLESEGRVTRFTDRGSAWVALRTAAGETESNQSR